MKKEMVRIENVSSESTEYSNIHNFNLHIYKGEIMGLICINDHGKHQLLQLLSRNAPIKYGRIYLDNKLVNHYCYSSNSKNRVYVMEQNRRLIQDLTVSDNIFVIRPGFKKYLMNRKVMRTQVESYLREIDIHLDPDEIILHLSPLKKAVVELLRAVIFKTDLLIINEISNQLSALELKHFHRYLRYYAQKGLTILYVGRHHEEVFQICDRVALMKDGQAIKVLKEKELHAENILPFTISFEDTQPVIEAEKKRYLLHMEKAVTDHLNELDFFLNQGECAVLFDKNNSIFGDLLDLFFGNIKLKKGRIVFHQEGMKKDKIVILGENPLKSMLFYNMSALENLCFLIDRKLERNQIPRRVKNSILQEYEKYLGKDIYVKDIRELDDKSLYNLVYYRIHLYHPELLVIVQPFSGADMYLRRYIVDLIRMLKKRGISILIFAVNLSDTLTVSDRLLIVENGRLVRDYERKDFNQIKLEI